MDIEMRFRIDGGFISAPQFRLAAGLLIYIAAAGAAEAAPCNNIEEMRAKIAPSGLNWERRGEELWRVDMPSQSSDLVRVILSCGGQVVPVFPVLAFSKDLKASPDLFMFLLRAASHFDRVKIAVDGDGDYLVRIDLWPQTFDGAELAAAVAQIQQVPDSLTSPLRDNHANR